MLDKLKEFMDNTDGFSGITMLGYYEIGNDLFLHFFKLYSKTGTNYLNHYHNIVSETMGCGDDLLYDKNEIDNLEYSMSLEEVTDHISIKILKKVEELLRESKERLNYINSYQQRRIAACVYTSKPSTRAYIFDRDGKICKHCGTDDKLTLDHIIPVSKGGEDKFDNLQVLCRSCNSIKGDKIA